MAGPRNTNGGGDGEFVDFGGKFMEAIRKNVLRLLIVALVFWAMSSSYYQLEPEEIGLVTRFGRYIDTAHPGFHFKAPFGIDSVIRIPVQRQLKAEFGFRTDQADVRTEYSHAGDASLEARMLTGDLNVANVEWIVQYKIRDPKLYAFSVRNASSTLRDMSEATMRRVVGDHSVNEVLTYGRETVQSEAKTALQELCDRYATGIEVMQLVLQDVNPPEAVRASFNEVNEAIQERERAVNQAWSKYNAVIPEARGKAEQTVQSAEGYATERVNQAEGDVQHFNALQTEYAKAPRVTRTRMYLETMTKVLPAARRRVVIDDNLRNLMPLLSLDGKLGGGQ